LSNTTGTFNTANGAFALFSNTTGLQNTANGTVTLVNNVTGSANSAFGAFALNNNFFGDSNTAIGTNALQFNFNGSGNTATGAAALLLNTTGTENTATGFAALQFNDSGFLNTAIGYQALLNNTGGAGNTALGYGAGQNLTIGDDNICIGNDGVAGDGGTIRVGRSFIGATYIAGIFGQTSSGGTGVFINSDGKLGTTTSCRRFKEEVKPMERASEVLFELKPVTFRYKKGIDPQGIPQFGLVAEEVAEVNPDLVVRDKNGEIYSVRYEQINAMLLNEFLKAHRKVQEQEATIEQLKKDFQATVAQLATRLDEQASQIQKVNAQLAASSPSDGGLEASKPAPQVVNNP